MRTLLTLAAFLAAAFAAAAIGVLGQGADTPEFYAQLAKPGWAPPASVFGPVWSVLYVLIGVSAWLVWREGGWSGALTLWAAQLVLNAVWTPVFFGARSFGLALAVIVVLFVLIAATVVAFWRRSRLAGGLLVPYLAWVGFATALNASIWSLN
jgi:translocator protein